MKIEIDINKQFPTPRDVAQVLWSNAIVCEEMGFRLHVSVIGSVWYRPPVIDLDFIIKVICSHYNLTTDELLNGSKKRKTCKPRQIAQYFAKKILDIDLAVIGDLIGGKTHGTVVNSLRRVESLMYSNKHFKEEMNYLQKAINSATVIVEN